MRNLSKMFQNKKAKRHTRRLSFVIIQFKIEFLLPLTGCRKVLEKMPVMAIFVLQGFDQKSRN